MIIMLVRMLMISLKPLIDDVFKKVIKTNVLRNAATIKMEMSAGKQDLTLKMAR